MTAFGSRQIMRELTNHGVSLTERTIRYHLKIMDERGLTTVFGKNGRKITEKGLVELNDSNVSGRVGFIISKIESLSFMSDFDFESQQGKVILNISFFPSSDIAAARKILTRTFKSDYVMSRYVMLAREGECIGSAVVPEGMCGIGTICSVTVNAILLKQGIPITARYGGLMEVTPEGPKRFTSLISYDGCSLDPLLVFIRSGMTSVGRAIKDGSGGVLASFREIPVECTEKALDIQARLREIDISGLLTIGKPNSPLLEMPVGLDKTGVVVVGGLNPIAALFEQGIEAESFAMAELVGFEELKPVKEALESLDR
jgi:repressor of nif and glnA expression